RYASEKIQPRCLRSLPPGAEGNSHRNRPGAGGERQRQGKEGNILRFAGARRFLLLAGFALLRSRQQIPGKEREHQAAGQTQGGQKNTEEGQDKGTSPKADQQTQQAKKGAPPRQPDPLLVLTLRRRLAEDERTGDRIDDRKQSWKGE